MRQRLVAVAVVAAEGCLALRKVATLSQACAAGSACVARCLRAQGRSLSREKRGGWLRSFLQGMGAGMPCSLCLASTSLVTV